MKYFLFTYDRRSGRVVDQREYRAEDHAQAVQERFARELARQGEPDIEIILLGAESLDDLKRTHVRFFKSAGELAGILGQG